MGHFKSLDQYIVNSASTSITQLSEVYRLMQLNALRYSFLCRPRITPQD